MLRRCTSVSLILTLTLCGLGCGTASGASGQVLSQSPGAIDFALELDGEAHRLSEWRGRPLVLVLLLTSDVTSQLYMPHVEEAFRHYAGRLRFLALTVEPTERPFVATYVESEGLHFPLGVAAPELRQGRTALGTIPLVPITFILDERGEVRDVGVGVVTSKDIGTALRRALGSGYGK